MEFGPLYDHSIEHHPTDDMVEKECGYAWL